MRGFVYRLDASIAGQRQAGAEFLHRRGNEWLIAGKPWNKDHRHAMAERAHGGTVSAMGDDQRSALHDRIVRRIVEHGRVIRHRKLARRDDAAVVATT